MNLIKIEVGKTGEDKRTNPTLICIYKSFCYVDIAYAFAMYLLRLLFNPL